MGNMITELTQQYIQGSHMMRVGALERLTDADLLFSPGGTNVTLGQLFKSYGEIEFSYIQSLKTGVHDWSYQNDEADLETNVTKLTLWFESLDQQMVQQLDQLTEDDLSKPIDRGHDVIRTVAQQLEIYIQAYLIFLGKLVIYFNAMEKALPPSIQHYIA